MATLADVAERPRTITTDSAQLRADLVEQRRPLARWTLGSEQLALIRGENSAWLVISRGDRPFLALRAAYFGEESYRLEKAGEDAEFRGTSALGDYRVSIGCQFRGLPTIRLQCWLTPSQPFLNTNWPRDLFPIGPGNDPSLAKGKVEAAQRGLNSGLLYAQLAQPKADLLYWQDFTPLAEYFEDSGTNPGGAVGGHWPELGFQLPEVEKKAQAAVTAMASQSPPRRPTARG